MSEIVTGVSGHEYEIGDSIGTLSGPDSGPCDASDGTKYRDMDGNVTGCTCIVCDRCGRHTGNAHQGHFWAFCQVTKTRRDFHLCCPGDCELEAIPGRSVLDAPAVAYDPEDENAPKGGA